LHKDLRSERSCTSFLPALDLFLELVDFLLKIVDVELERKQLSRGVLRVRQVRQALLAEDQLLSYALMVVLDLLYFLLLGPKRRLQLRNDVERDQVRVRMLQVLHRAECRQAGDWRCGVVGLGGVAAIPELLQL